MKDRSNLPVAYVIVYTRLAALAKELGYALALHGSMARDLDVIAVPWTNEAVSAGELVDAMVQATGGYVINDETADPYDYTKRCPEPKPHGRLAWSIYLGGGPYIDLSVMPRIPAQGGE